jgi:hypothetical protein
MNNYRLYHDPSTDLWTVLPTGLDQTFDDDDRVIADLWQPAHFIAVRCLEEPACEQAFIERLQYGLEVFQKLELFEYSTSLETFIKARYLQSEWNGFPQHATITRTWLESRVACVQEQIQYKGPGPLPSACN